MGAKKVDGINTQFASQHPLLSSFISPRLIFEIMAELLLPLLRHSDWGAPLDTLMMRLCRELLMLDWRIRLSLADLSAPSHHV